MRRSFGQHVVALTIAVLLLPISISAQSGGASLSCPVGSLQPGDDFIAELVLDVGERVLGAYQIAVTFDPARVRVTDVQGGASPEFATDPIANPAQYTTGRVLLVGYNAASLSSPTGEVSVARIIFAVIDASETSTLLDIHPDVVADTDGAALKTDAVGCQIMISNMISTPTPTVTLTPPIATATLSPTPTLMPTPIPGRCTGDCNADARVTVDELILGTRIALETEGIDTCPNCDANNDRQITVNEIIAGIGNSLSVCHANATTSTATPTATPTSSATNTEAVETATPDGPPLEQVRRDVYYTYPGLEVQRPICPVESYGRALLYAAENLPDGATVDSAIGVLAWTPRVDQLGPFYVSVDCIYEGPPPRSIGGTLVFQVMPPDDCVTITCDPAAGCDAETLPLQLNCCSGSPPPRIAYADVPCPEGAAIFAGRNIDSGIGRIQDCDSLRVLNFLQAGAAVRLHLEVRCLRTDREVMVRARLETRNRLLFDREIKVVVDLRPDGYAERIAMVFPVLGPGPFFEFQGEEAILTIDATDVDGMVLHLQRHVLLTFDPTYDLLDPVGPSPPKS